MKFKKIMEDQPEELCILAAKIKIPLLEFQPIEAF
jgi:hypothetical protein